MSYVSNHTAEIEPAPVNAQPRKPSNAHSSVVAVR